MTIYGVRILLGFQARNFSWKVMRLVDELVDFDLRLPFSFT
jgi:hypothetical protein